MKTTPESTTESTETVWDPGSTQAIKAGCTCPVLDNCHGKGYMGQEGVFIYSFDCPYHQTEMFPDDD